MNNCCNACQKLLNSSNTHSKLILLSEVTGSQIFKCQDCETYMHCVLGVWEVFMASPQAYKTTDTKHSSDKQNSQPISPNHAI